MPTINGTSGNDLIDESGNTDNLDIFGGDGNDTLIGGLGNDEIHGENGDDSLVGNEGDDKLFGGDGNDTLEGGDGKDELNGGAGNDSISGGAGEDKLNGGAGDDYLDGGAGKSDIKGGDGNDTLVGDMSDDKLEGDAGDDLILAGDGHNDIKGGTGNDTITSGSGEDSVEGGDGNDLISTGGGKDQVDGGLGDDTIFGGGGDDDLKGGEGNDEIHGEAGNDKIEGKEGNDLLDGGDGDDDIKGGIGADTLRGGAGNDKLDGEDGADLIEGGEGADTIKGGKGADTVDGGGGDDDIDGDDGNDEIYAGPGNDTVDGGKGDDTISGGEGDDELKGGSGNDTAVVSGRVDDYSLTADGTKTIIEDLYTDDGDDGTDVLSKFESIYFEADDYTLDLTGGNNPPLARDDAVSTDEDSSVVVSGAALLANDFDPDAGDTITIVSVDDSGSAGSVTDNGDGTYTYDPGAAFNSLGVGQTATDTFTYTISDASGATDTATVTVTINGVNDAPTANDDGGAGFTTDEDSSLITASVLANDTDPDTGDVLSVSALDTTGTVGLVNDNGDGTFTYDPNGQFESLGLGDTATDSFTYTVSDGNGGTDTATVTITINGVNDPPNANADSGAGFTTDEDNSFITASVLTNDTDPEGDALSVSALDTTGTVGLVTDNGDGTFTYDPNGQFEGLGKFESTTDTFTYTVSDGNGGTDTATVTITINGVNDAPNANDDGGPAFTTDEDTAFVTGSVLANDSDPDTNDSFNVFAFDTTGTLGSVGFAGGGFFNYDPNGQFESLALGDTATDTFSYTISDGKGGTDTATVTITIEGQNDTPFAEVNSFDTTEDFEEVVIDLNTLVGDVDNGDVLTISGVTGGPGAPALTVVNGVVTFDTTGYDSLSLGDSESFTIQYTVTDDSGAANASSVQTLTVNVNGLNDTPIAGNTTGTADESADPDVPLVVDLGPPLTSDPDANDTLSYDVVSITQVSNQRTLEIPFSIAGSVLTIDAVQFGLGAGEVEDFLIIYSVTDDSGAPNDTATGEILVTVTGGDGVAPPPDNARPVANDVTFEGDDETEISINLLAETSDADPGDTLSIQNVVISAQGREDPVIFELTPSGELVIDPTQFGLPDGETITIVGTYTVNDGSGAFNATNTGAIEIQITGIPAPIPNSQPVTTPQTVDTTEDVLITVNLRDFVSDPDAGDILTISDVTFGGPSGEIEAEFTIDETGGAYNVTFDPAQFGANDGETITITLGYVVTDDSGESNASAVGAVTYNITGTTENADPVAANATFDYSSAETSAINQDLEDFLSDPDGDTVTVTSVTLLEGAVPATTQPTLSNNIASNIDFSQFGLGEDDTTTVVLQYTVTDGNGGTDTGEITYDLTGNSAPTATPLDLSYDLDDDTGDVTFDLNTLVGDPDAGDLANLVITIEEFVTSDEEAVTFDNTNGMISFDPTQFGVPDGQTIIATLVYNVDDGSGQFNSQTPGTVDITISNPLDDPTPILDFEEINNPNGFETGVDGSKGFVFGGSSVVIETDKLPLVGGEGGRGDPPRIVEQGLLNGQTTPYDDGGTPGSEEEDIEDDYGTNVLVVGPGDENQPFSINGIGATLDPFGGSQSDPGIFGGAFDMEGISLNGAYNDGMEVTVTPYRVMSTEVLGVTTYSLVAVDSFVFNVDATTPALQLDLTTLIGDGTQYDDPETPEFETYAFENIVKVEFEVTNPGTNAGVGGPGDEITIDDVMIIL